MQKFNLNALASAGAIVSALTMLLLGILGRFGMYQGAGMMMEEWHMFSSASFGGIIIGMIEAAIISYVFLYLFGWLYNKLAN